MLKIGPDQKKLETLIDINALINSDYTDLEALLTRIIDSAISLTGGDTSSLLLVHPENKKLYFEIALGRSGSELRQFSLDMGEGIAGWVAQHRTSLIVNDVNADARFHSEISRKLGFPTHSILAVPMSVKGKCVGVIEIINKKNEDRFDEEDLKWLEVLATQAGIAIQNARAYQKVRQEIFSLQEQVRTKKGFHTMIFESKALRDTLAIAERAAQTDSTVLLTGESGVGKELFAEQIHLKSRRNAAPFIRVNCAALPSDLVETELFGHVKGAFTDAVSDRRGRFELADHGTIFLDEIADLPAQVQVKLLRVLQQHRFEPVGSSRTRTVDVRIVAATNRDVERLVQEGRFRADLYYRLNVLPIFIPPLRSRRADILALADHFLERHWKQTKKRIKGFSDEARTRLLTYAWPGNVRELENIVERAAVMTSENEWITPDALFADSTSGSGGDSYNGRDLRQAVTLFKKQFVTSTLHANGWNQTKTAKVLGIQRTYLSRLIKELQISKE